MALAINGSWWVGTALAAYLSYTLLSSIRETISWRLGFFIGAILALAILTIRRFIPESPRWLLTHGRADEAERVVAEIEEEVRKTHPDLPEPEGEPLLIEWRRHIGFGEIARYVVKNYPERGVLEWLVEALPSSTLKAELSEEHLLSDPIVYTLDEVALSRTSAAS